MGQQRVMNRLQLVGGFADPEGQGRPVNIYALTRIDLRLAVQRQMIGIL